MSKPPLPDAAVAMLRKSNPAVITTLRRDGQPVSTATWYLWDDGRVLVNMDEGRKRLAYMRADPRVSLDVLDEETTKIRQAVGEETWEAGRPRDTREIFERVALSPQLIEFLTIPAYRYLD